MPAKNSLSRSLFNTTLLFVAGFSAALQNTNAQRRTVSQPQYREVEIKLRVFIPSPAVNFFFDVQNAIYMFGGDARGFSYDLRGTRFDKMATITTDPARSPTVRTDYSRTITTIIYRTRSGRHLEGKPRWWWELLPGQPNAKEPITQDVPEDILVTRDDSGTLVQFTIGGVGNPFGYLIDYPAPNGSFTVLVRQCGNDVYYQVAALHDKFPAYEMYINRKQVYGFMPDSFFSPVGMMTTPFLQEEKIPKWIELGGPENQEIESVNFFDMIAGLDTGLSVRKGDQVTVAASGAVRFGDLVGEGDPDGLFSDEYFPLLFLSTPYNTFKHGTLMAVVSPTRGRDAAFAVRSLGRFIAPISGRLFLTPNDSFVGDNRPGKGSTGFKGCVVVASRK